MNLLKKFKGTTSDVIIILMLIAFGLYRHHKIDFRTIISLFLFIIGAAVGLTARYQLGNSFSVSPQAKKLITTGIYSKIRHPIYFAGIIINIGLCLLYKHWIFYVLIVLIVIIQTIRSTKEEKILTKTFGQEYIEYKKSTWF